MRVVNARFGIILSDKGGALKKMLPFFKLGLGGPLGDGSQYFSWVALEDVVGILNFALENEKINGPINVTAPNPVTNAEFTKLLAAELKRPAFFRVPKFVLHLILGEMADEALLSSTRAVPKKIIEAGYEFKQPQVKSCL